MSPHPSLKHIECKLNGAVIWRIRRKESEQTTLFFYGLTDSISEVKIDVVQTNNTSWLRIQIAMRRKLIDYPVIEGVTVEITQTNGRTG